MTGKQNNTEGMSLRRFFFFLSRMGSHHEYNISLLQGIHAAEIHYLYIHHGFINELSSSIAMSSARWHFQGGIPILLVAWWHGIVWHSTILEAWYGSNLPCHGMAISTTSVPCVPAAVLSRRH